MNGLLIAALDMEVARIDNLIQRGISNILRAKGCHAKTPPME